MIAVETVNQTQEYLKKIKVWLRDRASYMERLFNHVFMALIEHKDNMTFVDVHGVNKEMQSCLWFKVKGKKYYLTIQEKSIEVKENKKGKVLKVFTKESKLKDINEYFEGLKKKRK